MSSRQSPARCNSTAQVLGVHAGQVELKVSRELCRGCNGRCLGLDPSQRTINLPLSLMDKASLTPGDTVSLSVPRATLIGLSSLVYLLPVVLMLLFAIACNFFAGRSELHIAAAALAGLSVGFYLCHLASDRLSLALRSQISVACDS